ncbi:MAG TPA: hypothetical protein VFV41_12135 [Streptosporangiaceae bacterium]|nr:hypothetical protein [Streptosporangiaceae bacterium]
MALIVVAADKGAPGVTTTSVALAAVWPRPVLLAECDPAGGDVVYRLQAADGGRLDPRRGLLSLAVAARRGIQPSQVWEHTQKLRGGLDVLVGITNAEQGAGLDPMWGQVGEALAGLRQGDVIADCGRIGPEGRHYDLLARADAVVLIARASLGDMVRLRDRVNVVEAALRRRAGTASRIGIVVIADYKHFSAALAEVRQVLGRAESPVSVLGGLAFEPKSAELLSGEWGGKLDKSLLIRTAREIASGLAGALPAPQHRPPEQAALPAPEPPASARAAPELSGRAAPGVQPGASVPGQQQRRGRRGVAGQPIAQPASPAAPASPALPGYSPPPVMPAASAGPPPAGPPADPRPFPPVRDWSQMTPAPSPVSSPPATPAPTAFPSPVSAPGTTASPFPTASPDAPGAAPPLAASHPPAPSHHLAPSQAPDRPGGRVPDDRIPMDPLSREPQPRGGTWPMPGSPVPDRQAPDRLVPEPPLAALPPLPPVPHADPAAPANSAALPPAAPAAAPPTSPRPAGPDPVSPGTDSRASAAGTPLRQVPGDQTYGAAVLPPLTEADREPGRAGRNGKSQPEPGNGLLGPAYDSPDWHRTSPPPGPADSRPSARAGTDPAGRPGQQAPVLRGAVLPPAASPDPRERARREQSGHQQPGNQQPSHQQPGREQPGHRQQSDWWTAPDPWTPADQAATDHAARDPGAGDYGSYDHGSYDHGAASGGRGRHAGSLDGPQAPAADPGGR